MFYSLQDSNGIPLDKKLNDIFNGKSNGFYIELGANNGILQSNTAFFEKTKNWKGILIEPSLKGYEACRINRPNSICLNAACVSDSYAENTIKGDFTSGHLMSSIYGKRLQQETSLCEVKVDTLTNILNTYHDHSKIDLLSLDVEGYELNVLKGLDLNIYRPHYMLIEVYNIDFDEIVDFLKRHKYTLVCNFSNYSKETNPRWDGTHNDYLFIDSSKK